MKTALVTLKNSTEEVKCCEWEWPAGVLALRNDKDVAIKIYAPGVWETCEWIGENDEA